MKALAVVGALAVAGLLRAEPPRLGNPGLAPPPPPGDDLPPLPGGSHSPSPGTTPEVAKLTSVAGKYDGYYRVDRWGRHTFSGGFFVEPKARPRLEEHRDWFVTADLVGIRPQGEQRFGVVTNVGKVTPVKDAPIEVEIAWPDEKTASPLYRRIRPGGEFEFRVTVTNKMDQPFGSGTIAGNGFYFLGAGTSESIPPADVELDAKTDFGKPSDTNNEWQQKRFLLDVGRSRTWTVRVRNAPAGESEVAVAFLSSSPKFWHIGSNCLRLDVVDEKPAPAAGLEISLEPVAITPRPPRPIPAKLAFRNTNDRPVSFCLPYRGDGLAADQVLRCFDAAGTMILGTGWPWPGHDSPEPPDVEHLVVRVEAGKSVTFEVELPAATALAAGRLRGRGDPHVLRNPDEAYLLAGNTSVSGYVPIKR